MQTNIWDSPFLSPLFHTLDYFQTGEFFPFFFFQSVLNLFGKGFKFGDGDIFRALARFCVFLMLVASRMAAFSIIESRIESSFTRSKAALASSREALVL